MFRYLLFFFFNDTATTEIYTLSLHDALPIYVRSRALREIREHIEAGRLGKVCWGRSALGTRHEDDARRLDDRSEEHTSELQSRQYLVCRLLLEKKKRNQTSSSIKKRISACLK